MWEKRTTRAARSHLATRAPGKIQTHMEFIFELFAEMLGVEETRQEEPRQEETAVAPEAMTEATEPEVQPVNIFNVVNFH